MKLTFELPDFVNRDKFEHYSYCFEKLADNLFQYSITYFEFEVKDPKEVKDEKSIPKQHQCFFGLKQQQ